MTAPAIAPVTAPARPVRKGLLPALTGLRFFLALWVIIDHLVGPGHAFEPFAQMLPHPLYMVVRGGYLAVNTFFVLSGFVLARTYGTTPWRPRNLWKYGVGRVARVYPVYLLSLIIVAPFIVVPKRRRSPKDGWWPCTWRWCRAGSSAITRSAGMWPPGRSRARCSST